MSWAALLSAPALSAEPGNALDIEIRARLGHLQLSEPQWAQLRDLATKFSPQIADAERSAALTDAQRAAQLDAILSVARCQWTGADAARAIARAAPLTAEQKDAFRNARRLRDEFELAILEIVGEPRLDEPQVPPAREPPLSGFLIVRLSPDLPVASAAARTLDQAAAELDLPRLREVIDEFNLTQSERAIDSRLLDLFDGPGNDARRALVHRLRSYWQVDVRNIDANINAALRRLNALDEIDVAYAALASDDSSRLAVDPSNDPFSLQQGYLNAAPEGVNARCAWQVPAGHGAGVGLVDIERGWNPSHEDLITHSPSLVYGDIAPGNDHGTGVLGEIAGADNAVGVAGIAPGLDFVLLSSWFRAGMSNSSFPMALLVAVILVRPGDVVLIEYELGGGMPAEADDLNFDLISLGVMCGRVVIEAAGNGNNDLDSAVTSSGRRVWDSTSPDFRDSGALLVGASDPGDAHNRVVGSGWGSTYGSRVDCFGWGRRVTSAGCGRSDCIGPTLNSQYRVNFNGTSSAAAIVAGAAVAVQAMWKAKCGRPLGPKQLRAILASRSTGTPQGPRVPGNIGVMPDLKAIIAAHSLNCCLIPTTSGRQDARYIRRPRRHD